MKIKKEKDKDPKILNQIEIEIKRLQSEKDRHINNILILKSAFSIIDEMFMKEMENAEKIKKIKRTASLFCNSLRFSWPIERGVGRPSMK